MSRCHATPAPAPCSCRDEDVDLVGLSILSGSHPALVPDVLSRLREEGVSAPLVVGGDHPPADAERLRAAGVAAV